MNKDKILAGLLGAAVGSAYYVTINLFAKAYFMPIYQQFQGNIIADSAMLGLVIGHVLGTLYSAMWAYSFSKDLFQYPGEKVLAEGDVEVEVEFFEESSSDHKSYEGDALTRRNRDYWYKIYEDGERKVELNSSHVQKISWEEKTSGETGYVETVSRGSGIKKSLKEEAGKDGF